MKILVTGNMGYVGPMVTRRLRASYPEATLVGIDTCFFGHCLTGADMLPERAVDVQIFGDVRDLDESVLEDVDALVLLAAISNDPMGSAFEQVTADINCEANVRLARMARQMGVGRIVFASSCSVYGLADEGARSENAPLNPLTAYARSKIDTELALEPLAGDGLAITCLRFPTACGMSPRLRLDLVLNDFVASAVATGRIEILSDGTPWRPLIDVRDMARAIDWAISRDVDGARPFLSVNAGRNDANYQMRQLAEAVREVMPGVEIEINENAQPDRRSYRVSFDLYKQLAPDHLPEISLRQSIEFLREGLERMAFSDARFRDSKLMRLKALAGLREANRLDADLRWTGP